MAPIAEAHRRPLEATEYAEMVQRTAAIVCDCTPPGAAVAVVSRGDDALIALGGRCGWHFPRAANGAYAGHHPPDSAAAIEHLEELRASGAQYLVVPASARWWLDHYEQFALHLDQHAHCVAADPACAVYALAEPAVPASAAAADPALRERMRRFLDALLPAHCRVLVAGSGWDELVLPDRVVLSVPARPGGSAGEALADIDRQRRIDGPAYVVLPLTDEPDERLARLRGELERRRPLARRDRLALVFDLQQPTTQEASAG